MQGVRAACGPTAVLQTSTSPHTASNWNKIWLDLLGVIKYCNTLRFQIQINRWLTRELSSTTRTTLLASVFAEAFGLLFEILITSNTFTNVRTKGTRICGRGAMRVCGEIAVGQPTAVCSPIAISRHYVENRLQSLRADSSAGGTIELSGHSGTSSHRARVVVLPATDGPKTLCFTE